MTFREFGERYLEEYVKSYNRAYKCKESRIRILGRRLDRLPIDALQPIKKMPRVASNYVFYQPESLTRWYSCRKIWDAARDVAGHSWLRIHDLRHAYGIRLAESGVAMHFISEVMGHHSVDFTRKQYAQFSPESASRAVLSALESGRISTNLPLSAA